MIPGGIFGPNDIRVAFIKKFNANQVVRLDQTIYDQLLLTGLNANKYNVQQADLNQRQNDETIIYNISGAYAQIFVYREQLNLLKANQDALIEAGKERLLPILMTTLAMILGMLPLAIATGAGSEIKSGMAWVIIGGLTSSMILTLFVVPAMYLIIKKLKNRFSRKQQHRILSTT